ncbi:Panacea domain-containing protein [Phycicoccus jejuensis]|uniref:Panacea domain-containing protein n=1 Tax=Phycicoccus jejuensis TaxID=367299 RepID=UPI00146FF05F|nr:type II toxin-antitoxin system antitoxin SocA domain-containing protein [Phycicoccus jejuensis]
MARTVTLKRGLAVDAGGEAAPSMGVPARKLTYRPVREEAGAESVDDVAAAFLSRLGGMDAMKLQKLVCYAQAWTATTGKQLFADEVEAWRDGRVVYRLYEHHRGRRNLTWWSVGDPSGLGSESWAVIDRVVRAYGRLTGDELSAITYIKAPWVAARRGLGAQQRGREPITVESMASYYGGQVLAPADAVKHARANAALEGQSGGHGSESTLEDFALGRRDADEVAASLIAHYTPSG